ncbi:gamma-glutamyl cyclotransferase, AIG2-like domain-containing protein [Ditylenchus destructor]|uniref:Gamma-glutamylcyclotransferase family protein n=1 Tax=Ditylenchus destructor TaxID=166010 RepID=A0AAD4N6X6_9BILA|nr:gamma-glutamyl cyclotransferase, AIG2-like domain-containing protein [Ditylenchus destructor]
MGVEEHLVFVYGTLKTGEPNHHVLTDPSTGQYRLVGRAQTVTNFPLIIGSEFNIPFLLNCPGKGFLVEGEAYAVDAKKFEALDELEAHPHFYCREEHYVKLEDESLVKVWIYLLPTWQEKLFNEETQMLVSYSNDGPHGRKYVARYVRQQQLEGAGCEINTLIRGTSKN